MAGRPRKFVKELTTDERTMLETIAHSRTEEKRRVERAEVILGCAAGMSNVAIAEKLHISKPTVVKIRDCHEFCVHGIIGARYTGTPHEHDYQETNLS